jgi:hypothetical protein
MAAAGGLIVEIVGTHLCLNIGPWRLRFSLAIEDTDVQQAPMPEAIVAAPRLLPADKINRFYPNRR